MVGVGGIVRARFDDRNGLGSRQIDWFENRTPGHDEWSYARREREHKCVQRLDSGVIVDIIDLWALRRSVRLGLRIEMRMDQDAVIVILMNVLVWRQAKSQHQRSARLKGSHSAHCYPVYPNDGPSVV